MSHDTQIHALSKAPGKRARTIFVLVVFAIVVLHCAKIGWRAWDTYGRDFTKHYRAVELVKQGQSPYISNDPDAYPALTKWLFWWLGWIGDIYTAENWWDGWNGLMIFGAALLAAWGFKPRPEEMNAGGEAADDSRAAPLADPKPTGEWNIKKVKALLTLEWATWAIALTFLFMPVVALFAVGNVAPTNFFFLIACGAMLAQRRWATCGALLMAAALFKVITIVLILPFVFGRRWGVAAGAAAVGAAYVIGVVACGWTGWEIYLYRELLPTLPFVYQEISYGLNNLLGRLIAPSATQTEAGWLLFSTVVSGAMLAATAGILWRVRRAMADSEDALIVGATFALASLPLITPLLEYHHYVWIAPAWFLLWRRWLEGRIGGGAFALEAVPWAGILGAGLFAGIYSSIYWLALAGVAALWIVNAARLLTMK